MDKNIFDQVADKYDQLMENNIGKYGKDISYYAEYKILKLTEYLQHQPEQILEFGCGTGRNISFLQKYFPDAVITGSDNSEESLILAWQQNPMVRFLNDRDILKEQNKYDLVLVANVFHHVPPGQRAVEMGLIRTLLSVQGELFIFEHNPYNPLTVRAVNTCPFDRDAVLLKPKELQVLVKEAGLDIMRRQYCLFLPAALKKLSFSEKFLTFVPLGGQYFIQAQKLSA